MITRFTSDAAAHCTSPRGTRAEPRNGDDQEPCREGGRAAGPLWAPSPTDNTGTRTPGEITDAATTQRGGERRFARAVVRPANFAEEAPAHGARSSAPPRPRTSSRPTRLPPSRTHPPPRPSRSPRGAPPWCCRRRRRTRSPSRGSPPARRSGRGSVANALRDRFRRSSSPITTAPRARTRRAGFRGAPGRAALPGASHTSRYLRTPYTSIASSTRWIAGAPNSRHDADEEPELDPAAARGRERRPKNFCQNWKWRLSIGIIWSSTDWSGSGGANSRRPDRARDRRARRGRGAREAGLDRLHRPTPPSAASSR